MRPKVAPASVPWSTTVARGPNVDDGVVQLTGALRDRAESDTLVLVVHGLGGGIDSNYCVRAAQVIDAHGWSTLRLALRGADRKGEDFYHAGLVEDVHAALQSAELARYRRLYVLGYSLGGHVSLHAAVRAIDTRLRGVVAVCAPLDLDRSAQTIDLPSRAVYRHHILDGLKDIYRAVAARHAVPTPLARVMQIKTIREWDALTVVPRHGFASVDDYYQRMSIGPQLNTVRVPTLLMPSRHDPMIPPWTFDGLLPVASDLLSVHWAEQGGHVGYPGHIEIQGKLETSVEGHALGWMVRDD